MLAHFKICSASPLDALPIMLMAFSKLKWLVILVTLTFAYISLLSENKIFVIITLFLFGVLILSQLVGVVFGIAATPFILIAYPIRELSTFKSKSLAEKIYTIILTVVVSVFFGFFGWIIYKNGL
jgi:hypothetical protein